MNADLLIASVQAWHWLAVGLGLMALAVTTRGGLWVWLGFGAWATGLAMLFVPLRVESQLIVCAVTALTAYAAFKYLVRPTG